MEHISDKSIDEALALLEEAAKQRKDEVKAAMSDKYTHLRGMMMDAEGGILRSLVNAKDQALNAAAHAKDVSIEKAREIANDVNKSVHQNPWPYIAGTAATAVLVGFLLGRSRR